MPSNGPPSHTNDILLIVFSMTGILCLAGWGIVILSAGNISASLMLAIGIIFCLALLVPVLILSFERLNGRELPPANPPTLKWWLAVGLFCLWAIIIVLGSIWTNEQRIDQLFTLPLFLLGIALPVLGFSWIAIGGLPTGSWRRLWASFGIGMLASTLAAALLEGLLLIIVILAITVFTNLKPELLTLFQQIRHQLTNTSNLQSIATSLSPYLNNPMLLVLVLIFVSVLIPIIEETLKPVALWILGKRLRSPAEGFALGALFGAGFALFEGMVAVSGMPQDLGVGLAERATSTLIHITASSLLGWGIASAQLQKQYWRLVLTFLSAVTIHGTWNGGAIMATFGALRQMAPGGDPAPLGMILQYTGISILGLLLLFILVLLPYMNHRLRPNLRSKEALTQGDIIAPPQP